MPGLRALVIESTVGEGFSRSALRREGGDEVSYSTVSQQVSWSDVNAFVLPKLVKVGDWPMAGSPAWCLLDDRDPVKWAAVLDAGQHWILRIEGWQQADCDASGEISSVRDWAATSRLVTQHNSYFAARPWTARQTCLPKVGGWLR